MEIFNKVLRKSKEGRFWQQSLVRLPGAGLIYTTLSTGQTPQKQISICSPCSYCPAGAGIQHESSSPSINEFPLTGNPGWPWPTPLPSVAASQVCFCCFFDGEKSKNTRAQDKESNTHRSGDIRQKWVCTSQHRWSPYSNSLLEIRTKKQTLYQFFGKRKVPEEMWLLTHLKCQFYDFFLWMS